MRSRPAHSTRYETRSGHNRRVKLEEYELSAPWQRPQDRLFRACFPFGSVAHPHDEANYSPRDSVLLCRRIIRSAATEQSFRGLPEHQHLGLFRPSPGQHAPMHRRIVRRWEWDARTADAVAFRYRLLEPAPGANQNLLRRRVSNFTSARRSKPNTDSAPPPRAVNGISEVHRLHVGSGSPDLRRQSLPECALDLRAPGYGAGSTQLRYWAG